MNGSATYRLQLHAGFTLERRERILPYLAELGVSHVYLSPCLQAVPGQPARLRCHRSRPDQRRISAARPPGRASSKRARAHDLRILLDIVPNHMSASQHNPWWDDVLAHGPFSEFADYFDIRTAGARAVPGAHLHAGARLWRGAREGRARASRSRDGRPRVKHYREHLAAAARRPGARLLRMTRTTRCFAELERLQGRVAPPERDRARHYRRACERAERGARRGAPRRDGCRRGDRAHARAIRRCSMRFCSGSSTCCTAGSSRASSPITGASSTSSGLVGISCRAARRCSRPRMRASKR